MFFELCGVHEEHEMPFSAGQNMWQAAPSIWHWSRPKSRPNRNQPTRQPAEVNNDSPPKRQRRKHDVTSCVHGDCGRRHTHTSSVSAGNFYETGGVNNRTPLASSGGFIQKFAAQEAPRQCLLLLRARW